MDCNISVVVLCNYPLLLHKMVVVIVSRNWQHNGMEKPTPRQIRAQYSFDLRKKTNRDKLNTEIEQRLDKAIALRKKNAMHQFGAVLLLGKPGNTYKVRLASPKATRETLQGWLDVANEECGTNATFVIDELGNLPRKDGCVFVTV